MKKKKEPQEKDLYDRTLDWILGRLKTGGKTPFIAFAKRELFILIQVARSVQNDEISRRAAALTYHTLLSLVPVLAVAFALFKSFGGFAKLQKPLEDFIFSQLALPHADQVAKWLGNFVLNVNGGAIAGVGVLVLFYSAGGLLVNVEEAFNRMWNVRLHRPLYVRLAIYWCILTLAPPIVALSISFSTTVISNTVTTWMGPTVGGLMVGLISPVSVAIMLFMVYVMVPDTHVPWKNAAISAVVTAVVWNAAKFFFLWSSRTSSKYSAVYGALSALPLLMVWIYASWFIVLFGASYSRARGETDQLTIEAEPQSPTPTLRVVARVIVAIWEAFREGKPITAEGLAKTVDIPVPLCRSCMELLLDRNLIEHAETECHEGTEYFLRRHLGEMSLASLDAWLADPQARKCETTLAPSPLWIPVGQKLDEAEAARRLVLEVSLENATATAGSGPLVDSPRLS